MQNIWIINQFANLPTGSTGTRHYSLAKYLINHDIKSIIIAGSLEHNTGKQRLKNSEKLKLEKCDDINFLWIRLQNHRLSSLKSRSINMMTFFRKLIFINFDEVIEKPQLIIGSTVSPFAALGAYLLSIKYHVPFIYEVRDLWPKTLIEMKVIKKYGFPSLILNFIDFFLAKRSKKIIVLMKGGVSFYVKKGIKKEKIVWISNGVEYKEKMESKKEKNNKIFKLTYLGSMGPSNSLETIIYAMNYIKKNYNLQDQIQLELIGEGSLKEYFKNLSKKLSLKNVIFKKPILKDNVHETLSSSDALILAMNNFPLLYQYGVSFNKLFDYLLSARPILFASCAKYDIIKASKSGMISKSGDYKKLAKNIIRMKNLTDLEKNKYGNNGRKYVIKNFLYQNLSEKLSITIKQTILKC